jgi:hypothetical protein
VKTGAKGCRQDREIGIEVEVIQIAVVAIVGAGIPVVELSQDMDSKYRPLWSCIFVRQLLSEQRPARHQSTDVHSVIDLMKSQTMPFQLFGNVFEDVLFLVWCESGQQQMLHVSHPLRQACHTGL